MIRSPRNRRQQNDVELQVIVQDILPQLVSLLRPVEQKNDRSAVKSTCTRVHTSAPNGEHVAGAVSCLAQIGIPDLVEAAPKSVDELASQISADPQALCRLMRAAAGIGVLCEGPDGKFSQTPMSFPQGTRSEPIFVHESAREPDKRTSTKDSPWQQRVGEVLGRCHGRGEAIVTGGTP